MSRQAAVLGLLAVVVMIVATTAFLSVTLNERPEAKLTGTAGGGSSSSGTLDVPCGSCDARHQRLKKDRSGKD
jgi:hypothetical protein